MMRALTLALVLVVAGCSAGNGTADTGAATVVAHASAYRGPAVVTGRGDPAACPSQADLEQHHNDMMNLRVDADDPGYAVARDYDLRTRQCIELKQGERVLIEGSSDRAGNRVRPLGQSQTYWTTAGWTREGAIAGAAESVKVGGRARK